MVDTWWKRIYNRWIYLEKNCQESFSFVCQFPHFWILLLQPVFPCWVYWGFPFSLVVSPLSHVQISLKVHFFFQLIIKLSYLDQTAVSLLFYLHGQCSPPTPPTTTKHSSLFSWVWTAKVTLSRVLLTFFYLPFYFLSAQDDKKNFFLRGVTAFH